MKPSKTYILLAAAILYIILLSPLNAMDSTSPAGKITARFNETLILKGWETVLEGETLKAWCHNPLYQTLDVTVIYQDRENDIFRIIIDSERDKVPARKIFQFKKSDIKDMEKIESFLLPYLISLTNSKTVNEKHSGFYGSAKAGYYRTNDNSEILPEKSEGMYFAGFRLIYDPYREAAISNLPLYAGDYMDSSYSVSINREGKKFFDKIDELSFDIDFILYGKHNTTGSGDNRTRNLYGLFTGIAYYRPIIKSTAMLWSNDVYTDHYHIQYCYWEMLSFRQELTFSSSGKDLYFKYSIGLGPGQNSSLNLTNISSAEENSRLDPGVFTSYWYTVNGFGDRQNNYYYSMTYPVRFEFIADRYLNSRFQFNYDFYFFQATHNKNVYDFLNRLIFSYGFYITENITAGFGYEFWHIKSVENEYDKSHYWNRLNLQMEMKI
jgi:hypothetical protein